MAARALLRPLRHPLSARSYTTSAARRAGDMFRHGPAPPRLPESEQKIFEDLQRRSTGAFSTPVQEETAAVVESAVSASADSLLEIEAEADLVPDRRRARPRVNQPDQGDGQEQLRAAAEETEGGLPEINARVRAQGQGEELHPDVRRGAGAEFDGERNPSTGEVGGPKNEPLRWGGEVDWSYNGRVTDF